MLSTTVATAPTALTIPSGPSVTARAYPPVPIVVRVPIAAMLENFPGEILSIGFLKNNWRKSPSKSAEMPIKTSQKYPAINGFTAREALLIK